MNILILDDHNVSIEGTKIWIEKYNQDYKYFCANNFKKASDLLIEHPIDIIISDIELNNDKKNGFDLAQLCKKEYNHIKLIAFTNYCTYRVLKKAMESGFDIFLSKNIDFRDFAQVLDNINHDKPFISKCQKDILSKRKMHLSAMFKDSLYGLSLLSNKEREILILLTKTQDRKELAEKLYISPFTIDTHIKSLRHKLELGSKKELALFAREFEEEIIKL